MENAKKPTEVWLMNGVLEKIKKEKGGNENEKKGSAETDVCHAGKFHVNDRFWGWKHLHPRIKISRN